MTDGEWDAQLSDEEGGDMSANADSVGTVGGDMVQDIFAGASNYE